MTLVLCKVIQCSLRRPSAPDGARDAWQQGLLIWPVVKEEPQMTLLQWDWRRRMWWIFRRGSTWGQYSGQVHPYDRCTQQQLTTGKHRSWWALPAVPWPSPAQSVALGTWKKPTLLLQKYSCSPCKVSSIWYLAAGTCYTAPRKAHLDLLMQMGW